MLLTQEAWDDLAIICEWYRVSTPNQQMVPDDLARRLRLCRRIEDASR